MSPPRLVLASASPRRLDLLRAAGYEPLVDPGDVDETPDPVSSPTENAARFARDKALAVRARRPGELVLGADTVVEIGGELFGKPKDATDARRMLERLSGRAHRVVTCVHLAGPAPPGRRTEQALTVATTVVFRELAGDEISGYLSTGEWRDKAGGYGVQGYAAAFTQAVMGSYTNVVGLPLAEVVELLRGRGLLGRMGASDPGGGAS